MSEPRLTSTPVRRSGVRIGDVAVAADTVVGKIPVAIETMANIAERRLAIAGTDW